MKLQIESYESQLKRWPMNGSHILAQFDDETIVVYQAYNAEIGTFAAKHGYFGGSYSLNRMSWIKTNFLWMMYRSNWGTSLNQEVVLAIWLKRAAFEQILSEAVPTSFNAALYGTHEQWNAAMKSSNVRLQWDPDHNPHGQKQDRRAVQLGMKGSTLKLFAREWIVRIEDISPFVAEQRAFVEKRQLQNLITPTEHVYVVENAEAARRVCASDWNRN